jgi:protein gp37
MPFRPAGGGRGADVREAATLRPSSTAVRRLLYGPPSYGLRECLVDGNLSHMTATTGIEWTERTWNPTTGCTKVSPGCLHCYAEVMARRLHGMNARGYERGFELAVHEGRLAQPSRRKTPTTYFVNSMSDLFHKDVPDNFLDRVFDSIRSTPQHTYQILTKRAQRLPRYFASRVCPDNVWLGVSVENKRNGVPRIAHLTKVTARIRFLSVEPLLEDIGEINLDGIHWVIVGGESGRQARPMRQHWVQNVKRQCDTNRVAFFFKQWGRYGSDGVARSKGANGRTLRGRTWDAYPA